MMNQNDKTALVVLAAGIGSRFGGIKQMAPVGPNGEVLLDFSVYDAVKAGFDKVVFIITKEIERDFRELVGKRTEKIAEVSYAFQSMDAVPDWFSVPAARQKPWGTAHAVICAANELTEPFAVINADDYYGQKSYRILRDDLISSGEYDYSMVGFRLENTLTENGTVSRGVCETEGGYLKSVTERTKIRKGGPAGEYTEDGESWLPLAQGTLVSMNMWGFKPSALGGFERIFSDFLKEHGDMPKAECYLPVAVDRMLKEKFARVRVLETDDKWYGMTYQDDMPSVRSAMRSLIDQGLYDGI